MNADALAMEEEEATANKKWMVWMGRIISVLPILLLLASAMMKVTRQPQIVGMIGQHLGYPESTLVGLGLLELICAALYAIPATSVVGALLTTAYLGGAVASHVRVGDAFVAPIIVATLIWVGLYLRDRRLRALMPFRSL